LKVFTVVNFGHFLSSLGLLVAQGLTNVLFVQFFVNCADPRKTASLDFLSVLRHSDNGILICFWLKSKNIDQHVAYIQEHLLLMVKDEYFSMY